MLAQQPPTLGQNARISSLNPQQHPPVQNNSSGRQQKQQLTQHVSLPNIQRHRNLIHNFSEAKIMEAQPQSNRHASLVAFPFQGQQQSLQQQLQMQTSNALQLKSTMEQQKQHPFQAQEGIPEASSIYSTVETGHNVPYIQEELYQKLKIMKDTYYLDLSKIYGKISLTCQQVPLQISHWENHDNQMNQMQLTVVQSSGLSSTPMPLSPNMAVLHEQQLEFGRSLDQIHGNTGSIQMGLFPRQPQTLVIMDTPVMSVSPSFSEFTAVDSNQRNTAKQETDCAAECQLEHLCRVVKSISPEAYRSAVSDIRSSVGIVDGITEPVPGNGHRVVTKKMKRDIIARSVNASSSMGSIIKYNFSHLSCNEASDLESTVTSRKRGIKLRRTIP